MSKSIEEQRPLTASRRIKEVQLCFKRLKEIVSKASDLAVSAGGRDEHKVIWTGIALYQAEFLANLNFISVLTDQALESEIEPLRELLRRLETHRTDSNQAGMREVLAQLTEALHPLDYCIEGVGKLVAPQHSVGVVGFDY